MPPNPGYSGSYLIWSGKDHGWLLVLRPGEHERVILYRDDPVEQCLPLVAPAVWDAEKVDGIRRSSV